MTLTLSTEEAARFLVRYHLTPASMDGVFNRLGAVQYDPLNPVGRNHDLVMQSRVPGYRVDDWQRYAYAEREAYDAWDKQACLVPMADWAPRSIIRQRFHPWHDREVLDEHPKAVSAALAEIDDRGPLSSLEFEDRTRLEGAHSWYGPTRIKRILRALWVRGELVTHHREAGRHYYDRPERVVPHEHLGGTPLSEEEYYPWVVLRRHRAAGLLRPGAEAAIWSVCGDAVTRRSAIERLVEQGDLVPTRVGAKGSLYHMPASALPLLDEPSLAPRLVFLAPLDNMIWDRRATREIFGFEYMWEVYKRAEDRVWGYYVLPVLYGDRFVARVDCRLEGKTWVVSRWWWEEGFKPDTATIAALRASARAFASYLGAETVEVHDAVDRRTKAALLAAIPKRARAVDFTATRSRDLQVRGHG